MILFNSFANIINIIDANNTIKSIMTMIMTKNINLSSLEKANHYKYPNSKSLITRNIF